jgi:hypothetical protein
MIKGLVKLGIEGIYLNRGIYDKLKPTSYLMGIN